MVEDLHIRQLNEFVADVTGEAETNTETNYLTSTGVASTVATVAAANNS